MEYEMQRLLAALENLTKTSQETIRCAESALVDRLEDIDNSIVAANETLRRMSENLSALNETLLSALNETLKSAALKSQK